MLLRTDGSAVESAAEAEARSAESSELALAKASLCCAFADERADAATLLRVLREPTPVVAPATAEETSLLMLAPREARSVLWAEA